MSEQKRENVRKKGGNKSIVILGVCAVVIIAILVGIIVFLVGASQKKEKRNVVITSENVGDVLDELAEKAEVEKEKVTPGYYTVTMNNVWHFADGSAPSYDAIVQNVEENTNDVYFDIVLASDEDVVIYESPVIPIGGRLENIALDKDLDAGTYDCVVIYHLVDEEQNSLATLRITLKIIIEG